MCACVWQSVSVQWYLPEERDVYRSCPNSLIKVPWEMWGGGRHLTWIMCERGGQLGGRASRMIAWMRGPCRGPCPGPGPGPGPGGRRISGARSVGLAVAVCPGPLLVFTRQTWAKIKARGLGRSFGGGGVDGVSGRRERMAGPQPSSAPAVPKTSQLRLIRR